MLKNENEIKISFRGKMGVTDEIKGAGIGNAADSNQYLIKPRRKSKLSANPK
jgi:hypothetical protein